MRTLSREKDRLAVIDTDESGGRRTYLIHSHMRDLAKGGTPPDRFRKFEVIFASGVGADDGLTVEALLRVVVDHLEGNSEDEAALEHLRAALQTLSR